MRIQFSAILLAGCVSVTSLNAEPRNEIPLLLGCPIYYLIKDKALGAGEVRYLVKATREMCAYADLTGKTNLLTNPKPK